MLKYNQGRMDLAMRGVPNPGGNKITAAMNALARTNRTSFAALLRAAGMALVLILACHTPLRAAPPALPTLPTPAEIKARESLSEAADAYDTGDYARAARLFENYLMSNPSDDFVQYMLGATSLELGRFSQAEDLLLRSLKKEPNRAEAYLGLAKAQIPLAKYKEAAASLETYLRFHPDEAIALEPLASLYYMAGDAVKAEKLFSRLVAKTPNNIELWFNYAVVLSNNNKAGEALDAFRKVKKLNAAYEDIDYFIGMLSYQTGDYQAAAKSFAASLKGKRGGDAESWFNYGALLAEINRPADAIDALLKARAINPGYDNIDYIIGTIAYQNDRLDLAEQCFKRAELKGKNLSSIYGALGTIAGRRKDFTASEKYLRKARKLLPGDASITRNLIVALVQQEKLDAAVSVSEEASKKWPNDPEITMSLAVLYVQLEKLNQARDLLSVYLKVKPKDAQALRMLAALYEQNMLEADNAIKTYEKLVALEPKDTESRKSLAKLLRRSDRKPEAMEQYKALMRLDPKDQESWREAGLAMEKLDDPAQARAHYIKMADAFPNVAFPLARLGYMAETAGDTGAATRYFDAALKRKDIDDPGVFLRRAAIYEAGGAGVTAEMYYRQGLLKLLEHSQQIYMELSQAIEQNGGQLDLNKLMEMGDSEKDLEANLDTAINGVYAGFLGRDDRPGAIRYFRELTDKYPKNKNLLAFLSEQEFKDGNVESVMNLTDSLLKIDAKDSDAHIRLAWVMEQKRDFQAAAMEYKRAVESDPANRDALEKMVAAYSRLGRARDLIPYLERKLEKNKRNKALVDTLDQIRGAQEQ